ncbi:integrin alpha-M-like [Synchiropus splendidus]|uniref:integrin alpha-M-like n=1 Tax=Synchiropus splendidus TaxID=270530 RepID=UPI00237DE3C5|nr:integrin alpha-M-like [Synchiropus splendidus]
MDWIVCTAALLSVFGAVTSFNIDPVGWGFLSHPAAGFGYQVVHRGSDLLISAPLEQYSQNRRGKIFHCSTTTCNEIPLSVPEFAVNMSLGLTMVGKTGATLACGPTIPKDCGSITMYTGACLQISSPNRPGPFVPSSNDECQTGADIAFLLDGSGSVGARDFTKMKVFVKDLVKSFLGSDTQFSITEFATDPKVYQYFNSFDIRKWERQINAVRQSSGWTYTAKAIKHIVNNVFSLSRGSRPNVKKILIVITDGESTDPKELPGAAASAKAKGIVPFAIGVGSAFTTSAAYAELVTIASSPKNVFQVENFSALDRIRETLQEKIFSIEGSQTGGASLKMEMAQHGFSAAYVTGGMLMSVVGANQWRGGFLGYASSGMKGTSYLPQNMLADSYLGYSMAVAQTPYGQVTVVGAPRYDHRGIVVAVQYGSEQIIDPYKWEYMIGGYFGAVVCAMMVDGDSFTDLILISAPMFMENDREGKVYVCRMNVLTVECAFDSPLVLRGVEGHIGRFGASLAALPDLNGDGFNDLAVGAPLENDGQGSVYIFQGAGQGTIDPSFSQRIQASEVNSALRFFGMSIGQSSNDLSMDGLPDLAVGSKGKVVILRSRPIMMVEALVSFEPDQIPTQNIDCAAPLTNEATVCFIMRTQHTTFATAAAMINYTLKLDATRRVPSNRAYIKDQNREHSGSIRLDLMQQKCEKVKFFIEPCAEDSLNAINNELKFTFDGFPSAQNLKPSLAQQAQTTTFHPLGFEINCGQDNNCVDNLIVDFNFTSSSAVKVGIDELLDVTVSVENTRENSYNALVTLTYPQGLSYRKFTSRMGRIQCNSLDGEDGISRGKTECTVDKPIFKSNTMAIFIVSYGIEPNSHFDRSIFITANATSGNKQHSPTSELFQTNTIDVKYGIFMTLQSSLSYTNFSFVQRDSEKPIKQSITVSNDIRALNFTVAIRVPVKLGEKDIWADLDSLQIPGCQTHGDERPTVAEFVVEIQKTKVVDCSVATCRVFKCARFMGRLETRQYEISANVSSRWIEQIELNAAKFVLTSTASLEYDTDQYIFFSTTSNDQPPVRKIEVEVDVYPEPDYTKEIVGGSVGGLALLALLTAGLYKAGFFKSKYQNMMNENAETEELAGTVGETPAPEPEIS